MTSAENTKREFYSVPEVVERLGVGRTMVYRLLSNGEIGSVRIGNRRLVPATAYDAFVARLKGEVA